MTAYFQDIEEFAAEQFEKANQATKVIRFSKSASASAMTRNEMLSERYGSISAKALVDNPEFVEIETGYGKSIWAVVLAVDLRNSSNRAVKIGPKHTHLTMHTYLPTMINLAGCWDGSVVGLRGDGLIAQFGETELLKGDGTDVKPEVAEKAAKQAVRCGKAMIETIEEIVNPLLKKNGIQGNLTIGVGVDQGDLVVTRIGHLTANELTAYGPAVNRACKYSDRHNQIHVATRVQALYPKGKNGKVKFLPVGGGGSGLVVEFPSDMQMLERKPLKKAK